MRYADILREGKWWEPTPTLTLYHGTSSVLLPAIREHGLLPPAGNLADFVREVMKAILPDESQWPEPDDYFSYDNTLRRLMRNRSFSDQTANGARSLYFFPENREETPSVRGYARSYAQHGGEMAYEIWNGLNGYQKDRGLPPLPPRWPHGKPVIVTVEVPKEWTLWQRDPDRVMATVKRLWADENMRFTHDDEGEPYERIEDAIRDTLADTEVRVPRIIPPSGIRNIEYLDAP